MSLNGLAGAGKAKTAILESKGIYEQSSKASIQMFGGIFGGKSNKKTTTTRNIPTKTNPGSGEGNKENTVQDGGEVKANN
jgi:hypothetical protein